MKVFVTGASGYIGSAVARAFARAGHEVFGLTRSAEKGKALAADEVTPITGSMQDPSTYHAVASDCRLLIHCAADYSEQIWDLDRKTIQNLIDNATAARGARGVIYTSGVWVYGDTAGRIVDEDTALQPPQFVMPRFETETGVLQAASSSLGTVVIRPGCVYGGAGGLTASWFESATKEGAARVVGEGRGRWAMIHVEDLAALYVLAGESGRRGEVFNATDRSRFTTAECAEAASRAAGAGGAIHKVPIAQAQKQMGPLAEGLALDQHVDSSKAVRLLGWQPRHGGFVDGVQRYFTAWRARQRK